MPERPADSASKPPRRSAGSVPGDEMISESHGENSSWGSKSLGTVLNLLIPFHVESSEQEASAMTKILDEVLAANAKYAESFGDKGNLPLPPSRHFAILTCMDARLDPAKYAGLSEGDAHVIRNAGGRASDDAIRSLVISYKLLGTREWFVIHHT